MPIVLLKTQEVRAAILGTEPGPNEGSYIEIEHPLEPDSVVDGLPVSDWPVGVHPLSDETAYAIIGPPAKRAP